MRNRRRIGKAKKDEDINEKEDNKENTGRGEREREEEAKKKRKTEKKYHDTQEIKHETPPTQKKRDMEEANCWYLRKRNITAVWSCHAKERRQRVCKGNEYG